MEIDIKELAENLGISPSTLNSWLDHYTLFKFVKKDFHSRQRSIMCNKEFYENFKRYVACKHPRRNVELSYYYYVNQFEAFINKLRAKKLCKIH